ncbi:MAG: ASPIC/UnbV domain-containing protein, partial [Burkholderiales bacterium]
IELAASKSNRSAYGARVKVAAGEITQVQERRSGGSYLSQNDVRLHFGLAARARVESIEVRWPSGLAQTFKDVPANAFVRISEGSGELTVLRTISAR